MSGPGRVAAIALAAVAPVLVAGCGAGDDSTPSLLVFAAASLTDVVDELADAFAEQTGIRVEVNVAGSSTLREQILAGAPADVVITANAEVMAALVAAGEVDGVPVVVARNRLQLVVPAANPGGVTGVDDLEREDLLVGLCASGVPCGDLARAALEAAGVEVALDTDEPDVRALLTKVAEDELDVGVVYATDVRAAGDRVLGIDLPSGLDVTTPYPIAVLDGSSHRDAAADFVAFVAGPTGVAIFTRHGFEAP